MPTFGFAAPLPRHNLMPLGPGDVRLHVPVAHSIYDVYGRLLLRRGLAVASPRDLELVLEIGMKEAEHDGTPFEHGETRARSTFEQMEVIAMRLARIYQHLREYPNNPGFVISIDKLAADIIACCARDADAAFAAPHLDRHHNYETGHHLMAGVVCARIAHALRWPEERRRNAVAAVLTQDVALMPHRHLLDSHATLSDDERSIVHRHPEESARWMARLGVRDDGWLQCIRQHHMGLDGSGYPAGREAVCTEARISALADAFSAMLRPRPYRSRIAASKAIGDLHANAQQRYDADLVNRLIQEIGVFPPGSVVKLRNGDTGVVVRNRQEHPYSPEVWGVSDAKGHLLEPTPRNVDDPAYAIVALGQPESCHCVMRTVATLWDSAVPKHTRTPQPTAPTPAFRLPPVVLARIGAP